MNKSTFRNLAIVLFALVAILIGMEMSERRAMTTAVGSGLLFPEFRSRINDVNSLVVAAPGEEAVTISNTSGTWSVANRDDFPAQVSKIRELLLVLADAQILEEKTANPERYAALGVNDPELPDSRGVRLAVAGDDFGFALIVGDSNQGSNRYVRIVDQPQSLLIDADPALPDTVGGWLRSDLVDIESSRVSQVSIRHADDELIEILKSQGDTEFEVQDLPEGRELSYPTVVNGMASVLTDLQLEDVRRAPPGEPQSIARFETFDGLRLRVGVYGDADDPEGDRWIDLRAAANEMAGEDEAVGEDGAEPGSGDDNDAAAMAAAMNNRLGGWQFRVAGYKLDQLSRRWEDLLKAEED